MFDAAIDNGSRDKRAEPLYKKRGGKQTVVKCGDVWFGGDRPVVIAGPCSIESESQLRDTADAVVGAGANMIRGGAYKPRTSPYSFQGLEEEGLRLLRSAGDRLGVPTVTEVLSEDHVGVVAEFSDMVQIGARNMQNFSLLRKVAKTGRPVLLKRGAGASIKEWLSASEYLLDGGNGQVVLCERGIKSFERYTRNTLDLAAVALAKELTHLPVIVDPSHATGKRSLVAPMSRAALAAGADGIIVEVHCDPDSALSDKDQQLYPEQFSEMMESMRRPILNQGVNEPKRIRPVEVSPSVEVRRR